MFQRAGGDPEIFYLHGYWRCEPGQAWVIETARPGRPYWNFQLDNWWMESMDWDKRITVNKHTARLEDDGRLVLVVAAEDPGCGNWIDTTGHSTGTALLRWVGTEDHPLPDLPRRRSWRGTRPTASDVGTSRSTSSSRRARTRPA
jgi:hypothetical protein